jgi:histidinol-phosphate aminotransferase
VLAVMDEAYADFSDLGLKPDFCAMIRSGNYPNLVLLRTFSKAYGMAGLRLGYGIASEELIQNLHRVHQPFNVNGMAIVAGIATLENPHHKLDVVAQTRLGRNFIEQKLKAFEIPFLPSQANFLMVFVKDGKKAFDALIERDLIVRELASFGLPEYIRVTVSNPEHNRKCVNALFEIYKKL